jgi:hypothetical protein
MIQYIRVHFIFCTTNKASHKLELNIFPAYLCITGWDTFCIACHPEIEADNFARNWPIPHLIFLLNQQDLSWSLSIIFVYVTGICSIKGIFPLFS